MTYARSRLLVGTSGVGTVVGLAVSALLLDLPGRLLPVTRAPLADELVALALVLVIHVAVLAPFDLFGGYLLPRRFGRTTTPLARFFVLWLRGVTVQSTVALGCAVALLVAGRAGGEATAGAALVALMLLLLAAQAGLARLLAPLAVVRRGRRVARLRSSDPGFTGGIAGLPGYERFLVPDSWAELLGEDGLAAQLARWRAALDSRGRLLGVLVALAWNLTGFWLAGLLPGAGVTTVAGLVSLTLGFAVWSFVGLLVLPSISRGGVFAADRLAREGLGGTEPLRRTMRILDRLQDDEPERSRAVESVFHPIPALSRRLDRLDRGEGPRRGAWQAARMTLYLSIAGLGLLSRAVHCNVGRPDLWALLPCD